MMVCLGPSFAMELPMAHEPSQKTSEQGFWSVIPVGTLELANVFSHPARSNKRQYHTAENVLKALHAEARTI